MALSIKMIALQGSIKALKSSIDNCNTDEYNCTQIFTESTYNSFSTRRQSAKNVYTQYREYLVYQDISTSVPNDDELPDVSIIDNARVNLETSISNLIYLDDESLKKNAESLLSNRKSNADGKYSTDSYTKYDVVYQDGAKLFSSWDSLDSSVRRQLVIDLYTADANLMTEDQLKAQLASILEDLIAEAYGIKNHQEDYTEASWNAFWTHVSQSESYLNEYKANPDNVTSSELSSCIDILSSEELGKGSLVVRVDVSRLSSLIDEASSILTEYSSDPTLYLSSTIDNLTNKLASAKTTLSRANQSKATQSEVDTSANELEKAIQNVKSSDDYKSNNIEGRSVKFHYGTLAEYDNIAGNSDTSATDNTRPDTLYFTDEGYLFRGSVLYSNTFIRKLNDTSSIPLSGADRVYFMPNTSIVNGTQVNTLSAKLLTSDGSEYGLVADANASTIQGIVSIDHGGTGANLSEKAPGILKLSLNDSTNKLFFDVADSSNDYVPDVIANNSADSIVKISTDRSSSGTVRISAMHTAGSGYKHIPSGGQDGQVLTYESDGTAKWDTVKVDLSSVPLTVAENISKLSIADASNSGTSLIAHNTFDYIPEDSSYSNMTLKTLVGDSSGIQVVPNGDNQVVIKLDESKVIDNDELVSSLASRVRVVAVATDNIDLLSSIESIDGVVLSENDLVLLTNQTKPEDNGVYQYTYDEATKKYFIRPEEFDFSSTNNQSKSIIVYCPTGDKLSNSFWTLTNSGLLDNATAKSFTQIISLDPMTKLDMDTFYVNNAGLGSTGLDDEGNITYSTDESVIAASGGNPVESDHLNEILGRYLKRIIELEKTVAELKLALDKVSALVDDINGEVV